MNLFSGLKVEALASGLRAKVSSVLHFTQTLRANYVSPMPGLRGLVLLT